MGELAAGKTFGAESLLQPGVYRADVTSLCFTFCEVSFLKKAGFVSVIARNPQWDQALKKFQMFFRTTAAENVAGLIESLAEGDVNLLDSILTEKAAQEASVYTKMFQRVTKHLIRMRRM